MVIMFSNSCWEACILNEKMKSLLGTCAESTLLSDKWKCLFLKKML